MKTFYELKVEDMRGAGLAMGLAHTKTIKRQGYDALYKAINAANEYHKENYPNHNNKFVEFQDMGNYWTTGDLLCVMYTIHKLEIK